VREGIQGLPARFQAPVSGPVSGASPAATGCYGADLVDTGYVPGSRIDFVLSGGDVQYSEVHTVGSDVLTPGDLHPSDHLGVVATFEISQ
jgi:endonuclease/exonuclease/phosphatase family metal-dependent hydrolase